MSDRTWPRYADETPLETAALELSRWIRANPDPDACGIRAVLDPPSVTVYWKGPPPSELEEVASRHPFPVTFVSTEYSLDELIPIVKQLVTDHSSLSSAGPAKDYSGVGVTLWSKTSVAPERVVAALSEEVGVPVYFERYADPVPLSQ
jgi:hypothetical protein